MMPFSNHPSPPSAYHHTVKMPSPRYQRDLRKVLLLSEKVHENPASEKETIESLQYTLSDYSDVDLGASLDAFVDCAMNRKDIQVREVDDEVGWSQDRVYRVLDRKTGKPLAILKVFKESSKNFFPEVFSLQYLKKASLQDFSSPKIRALGRCKAEGTQYFVLCESVAAGCSLLNMYRSSPFETIVRGIKACGNTLAKLHLHALGKPRTFPEPLEKITREYLAKAVEKLQTYPQKGIEVAKLQKAFELILAKVKSKSFPTAVIHGDTKLINVFFDPETKRATWIDPPKLSESIDSSGNPIGIPAKDFYSFIADIEHQQVMYFLDDKGQVSSKKLMSDAEIQKLKEAFRLGYLESSGTLPTKEQLDFFSFAAHLYFIAFDTTREINCTLAEPLKSSKRRRMANVFKDLESRL